MGTPGALPCTASLHRVLRQVCTTHLLLSIAMQALLRAGAILFSNARGFAGLACFRIRCTCFQHHAHWAPAFQDYAALLGVTCMADLLRKRCAAAVSARPPATPSGLPSLQQRQQLPTESGFCDLTLSALALSTPSCRRETAHQV